MTGQRIPASSLAMRHLPFPLLHLVLAAGLATLGAFGSYVAMGFAARLLHFAISTLAIGTLIYVLTVGLRRYVFAGALPFWAMAAVALATAPIGGLIVQQSLGLLAPQALPFVSLPELTGQVTVISLAAGAVIWILRRRKDPAIDAPAPVQDTDDRLQALRAKLPVALRQAPIIALSAEDHYVRVRTGRGQALILMNLTDAIDALGPEAGVRIHRSHWVSRTIAEAAAVSRLGVAVDADTRLPVSRSGRKLLNAHAAESARV